MDNMMEEAAARGAKVLDHILAVVRAVQREDGKPLLEIPITYDDLAAIRAALATQDGGFGFADAIRLEHGPSVLFGVRLRPYAPRA